VTEQNDVLRSSVLAPHICDYKGIQMRRSRNI